MEIFVFLDELRRSFTSYEAFSFPLSLRIFLPTWLYIWVTRGVSYNKQELLTFFKFIPGFLVLSMLLIFLVFCVVLFCVFTFWVLCCDVHNDICIKTMFSSSVPLVVCWRLMSYLPSFCLCIVVSNTYCVLFFFILCTLCCHFFWIVHFLLPLRYSLSFI